MAKAASRCCELANPAQVRQIASQTEDLLRRMRFVAGRGRCGGKPSGRYCWPGALRRRAIGKMLPAGGAAGGMERSGSLNGRACRSAEDAAMQQMHRSRCNAAGAQKPLRCSRCTEDVAMQQMRRRRSDGRQNEKASKHRSLAQKKQPGTEACDPNAGCSRKIRIRVNILLTLRPVTREATTCGAAHHPRSNKLRSGPPPCEATTCGAARHPRSNNLRSSPPPAKRPAAAGRSAT